MEIMLDFICPLCGTPIVHSWEFSHMVTCPYCGHIHEVSWSFDDLEDKPVTRVEITTYLNRWKNGACVPYRVSTIEREF